MRAKNREALLALSISLFENLRSKYKLTHLYFTDTQRINILRVHKADEYRDKINRFTTREAERTGRIAHGIDRKSVV